MNAQEIQFAAGLKIVSFSDAYGRETEVCIGHRDIMVTHKTQEGDMESMRRYSKEEVEMIVQAFGKML